MRSMSALPLALLLACGSSEPKITPITTAPPSATPSAPSVTPEAPATPANPKGSGPIRQTWEALISGGCDLTAARIYNPVGARVLRNTPYALGGYRFNDVNLRLVFADDGGWYQPTVDKPPTLAADAAACVEKLKSHEEKLKKTMPIPEELAARMTRDHALFVLMRSWEKDLDVTPYGKPRFSERADGALEMFTTYLDCVPDEEIECGGYSVVCPSETPCEGVAAG